MADLQQEYEADKVKMHEELEALRKKAGKEKEIELKKLDLDFKIKEATATSEEEKKALVKSHQEAVDKLEKVSLQEKEEQDAVLATKLAARKQKMAKLKNDLYAKNQKDVKKQQVEMDREKEESQTKNQQLHEAKLYKAALSVEEPAASNYFEKYVSVAICAGFLHKLQYIS